MERRGEVWIAPEDPVPGGGMVDPATAEFWVSWQDEDDPDLHENDRVVGAEAAIAWGLERSPVVWIRLGHTGDTYFSAGEERPADDDPDNEFIPHWPPAGPPPNGWWTRPAPADAEAIAAVVEEVRAGEMSRKDAREWAMLQLHFLEGEDRETVRALVALEEWGRPRSDRVMVSITVRFGSLDAASQARDGLLGAGFTMLREDVEAEQPSLTVQLEVESAAPPQSDLPDFTGQDPGVQAAVDDASRRLDAVLENIEHDPSWVWQAHRAAS